jgi:hypothetical protein
LEQETGTTWSRTGLVFVTTTTIITLYRNPFAFRIPFFNQHDSTLVSWNVTIVEPPRFPTNLVLDSAKAPRVD